MRFRLSLLLMVFVLFSCSLLHAQSVVTGTIVYGAPLKTVPGVEVHLVNKSLKPEVDRKAVTDEDGGYLFEDVPAGPGYSVDVYDATGKIAGTDTPITVFAGQPHSAIPNIDISRGIVAERAALAGGLVENDRGISPGANVSNEEIRVLPFYNRNFLALGLIQPGVHDVEQGSPLQGAAFSINGARSYSTNFLFDGVDNVASSTNQAIPFQVNEAVREFRVIYATPSMRYGQGSGGVIDVVTSSGDIGADTSKEKFKFHGHLFGYFNNDSLNAGTPLSVYSNSGFNTAAAYAGASNATSGIISADSAGSPTTGTNCTTLGSAYCAYSPQSYNALFNLFGIAQGYNIDSNTAVCASAICNAGQFNPSALLSTQDSHTQPVSSQQFGGSIGGPLGEKLFVFLSYEGTRIENPTPIFERVPTFLDTTALNAGTDSTIAQNTLKLFPAANVGQTSSVLQSNGTGIFGFYRGQAPNYTHVSNVTLRPDLLLKGLGAVAFRYTGQLLDQLHDDTLPASPAYPGNGADRKAQNQSASAVYNYQFKANRNVASIAFTQYRVDEVAQDRGFAAPLGSGGAMPTVVLSGIDPVASGAAPGQPGAIGGWYDSFWQTCAAGSAAAPNCSANPSGTGDLSRSPSPITPSLDGDFPFARLGAPLSAPSKRRDTEALFADVLELKLGSNILSLGGQYRYQQNYSYDGGTTRGLIVSNNIGEFTHDSETCVSCGNAFTHPSFDYELRQPVGYTGDLRSSNYGVFVEDKFQANSQVTLTAGIRYEYFGQQLDSGNRLWNYNLGSQGLSRQGALGTFDAFDYQCGGGATFFDAVYGSLRASTPSTGWKCNGAGTFHLPSDKTNFTGLLGAAISPDGGYRHVIRVSAGGYYDRLPASYNQKLLLNRPSPYNVANPSSIYGQNFASSYASTTCKAGTSCAFGLSTLNASSFSSPTFQNYQAASAASILYDRDQYALKTPYTLQYNAGYEQTFSGSWRGEVNYTGSVGHRLPLVYDGNYANEFYCTQSGACNNDTYFPVFTESHIGISYYNSMVARVEGKAWHHLSLHASYTLSKSLDNIAGGQFPDATDSLWTQLFGRQLYGAANPAVFALQANAAGYGSNNGYRGTELQPSSTGNSPLAASLLQSANIPSFTAVQSALTTTGSRAVNVSHYNLPQNPLAFSSAGAQKGVDYGPSDFDVRHRFVADFVYDMPAFGRKYLKGFLVSGVTVAQTGQPFSIFSGPAYGQITQLANVTPASVTKSKNNPGAYLSTLGSASLPSTNNAACPQLYAQPTLYAGAQKGAAVSPAACVGSGPRNGFNGPGYFSQDLALQKLTTFHERQSFTIRAEFYNIFNRKNYYNPISALSNDGVHINPLFGEIRSAHDPYQLQLAVRYDF